MKSSGGWGTSRTKNTSHCHPEKPHYARGLCRECYWLLPERAEQRASYYQANRARFAVYTKQARERRAREAKRYGISAEAQEALLLQQKHLCALCGRPPGKKRLSVDHDHETGRVRAMLCGACNLALGGFRDDPELCERAARYLRDHSVQAATSAEGDPP